METDDKKLPTLTAAAGAVEQLLHDFEGLAAGAQRISLTSQRNIEKAAQTTASAAQCQERLGGLIQTFMAVLNAARDQNQETMDGLQRRAQEIKRRGEEISTFKERLGQLAQEAADISAIVKQVGSEKANEGHDALAELAEIEGRMTALVEQATALWSDCKDADFSQLASEVESLKQQTQSARNKVKLLRQRLTGATAETPS